MNTLHNSLRQKRGLSPNCLILGGAEETGLSSSRAETRLVKHPAEREGDAMFSLVPRPCARLRIQAPGSPEAQAYLMADDLPYVLGRDPGEHGHKLILPGAPPNTAAACSRTHLVLESYHPDSGEFQVRNAAHDRNGTYDEDGRALPERFLWRLGERLYLGGWGAGSVWVRLEPAR